MATLRFTKMQGAGNDYIYVDCFAQPAPADAAALSVRLSDRHYGVGGDGLILICPSQRADARMRMFNPDGTEAEMCGNGLRCVAKYLFDHGLTDKRHLRIETGRGTLGVDLELDNGRVRAVRVDMGAPILAAREIPTTLPGDPPVDVPLEVDGQAIRVTCLSMGNPHAVLFVEEATDALVQNLGPSIETDPRFPRRTNVGFVNVVAPGEIHVRVWERGTGETLACGTGACAALVAGVLTQRTERRVLAHLPGGDLEVHWPEGGPVYLTGPAVEVFEGTIPLD